MVSKKAAATAALQERGRGDAEQRSARRLRDNWNEGDKGFEVVGINLDQDRTAMEDFLKEMKVPWITLREEGGEGEHPVARHYGVEAIPFMALIGRDGKVISIEAYGEALANLLAEQFPE